MNEASRRQGTTADEPPPAVEGGSISGVVTDFANVPLVGVRVEAVASGGKDLDLLPVLSDGEGRFQLDGLAQGRYDLRFSLGQVKARTLAVPVDTDQLRVRLARPQGILLVVKTPPGVEPPDLTHVVLHRQTRDGLVREYVGTMLRRRLLLWSIRPGRYTLTIWGGPYLPVEIEDVEVREGQPAPEVELMLAAEGGTVEGTVVREGDQPIDALVGWRRLDGPQHVPLHKTSFETDTEGRFVVRGLPSGRYRFSAYRSDRPISDAEVDVEERQAASLTLRF